MHGSLVVLVGVGSSLMKKCDDTIRYDTTRYIFVHAKADAMATLI